MGQDTAKTMVVIFTIFSGLGESHSSLISLDLTKLHMFIDRHIFSTTYQPIYKFTCKR